MVHSTFLFPVFVMYLDSNDRSLKEWYTERVAAHNKHVQEDAFPNSGFDLAAPEDIILSSDSSKSGKLSTNVKGKMVNDITARCMGYYMYPRSSISKTPLVLSNHVGIIDSGYRGPLTGMFRNLASNEFIISKFDRYLQVCTPTLEPFLVKMVDTEEELGSTSRGEGGFGSTGK
jgi:deoxyuridine 5'-triphosphate nucleotidohydrolase